MKTTPSQHEMQRAFSERDSAYEGIFFVAVRTTGVFCRPTCPARKPRLQNVEFFDSPSRALAAGYRPCKRCRPTDSPGGHPDWVRRLLTTVAKDPASRVTDSTLRAMSIDPARARRYFRRRYGMTFQAYHRSLRMGRALADIRRGADLNGAGFDHGYDSSSGFRDAFARTFGGPPGRNRDRECLVTHRLDSPLGPLVVCATAKAVCMLGFDDDQHRESDLRSLEKRYGRQVVPGVNGPIAQLAEQIERYFAGELKKFTVPLQYKGTPFQRAVWANLCKIPYARTVSYKELAAMVKRPQACRAVGMANHRNPLVVVIPCHRVIGADGRLTGYGGGLWRKQFLLDHERGVLQTARSH